MTSKACFSNRTGFFRQLTAKQLWLFALWSVFPLSGMMEYSSITARADLMNLQFSVDRSFLSRTYVVLFMMPVLAIVFSSCFGYLNSRQKLDFYHSQPVTRVRLFFTNYLSGLFHFLIPYLVMHTLAFVLMNSITGFYKTDLRLLVWPLLYTLAAFLIFYSLVILFRVVCGNTVIAVLSYAFITNLPAIGYFLYQIYIGRWSKLYMGSATLENCLWLSPYTLLTLPVETTQYNVVPDSFGYSYSFAVDWISLLVWALIAVLAVAGGVLLYKSRPSEKAGRAVAVRGALPVIKYPLVVTASLLGGIFFTAATNGSLVWEIIGYVLFGLLALMLVNVLEKFDFKCCMGFGRLSPASPPLGCLSARALWAHGKTTRSLRPGRWNGFISSNSCFRQMKPIRSQMPIRMSLSWTIRRLCVPSLKSSAGMIFIRRTICNTATAIAVWMCSWTRVCFPAINASSFSRRRRRWIR